MNSPIRAGATNDTARPVPAATLPELFEAQAASSPDATAVVFEDTSLSYAELNARANQLAHHLRSLGVGPEVLVGLCVERSLDMLVGLLGILKAGGAYLPLDPAYPQQRLDFMLQDARPKVLLTQQSLLQQLPEQLPHTVCIDRDWTTIQHNDSHNPDHITQPHNVAYVIYTSGSTGTPKGVVVAHGGLTNYAKWALQEYPLHLGSGSAVNTSITFDATISSLLLPLLSGKAVTQLPQSTVSRHLKALADSGWITVRGEGTRHLYSMPRAERIAPCWSSSR